MINIINKEKCCGCSACADICPQKCITMECDNEGFKYPHVNTEECINCGACNNVCPIESPLCERNSIVSAYAGWNKNDEIRLHSTSGGVFSALAETIIQQNGIVIGAQYDQGNMVVHSVQNSQTGVSKLRQSKYVQSDTNGIFNATKDALATGKMVLFCGTPCQTEALVKFLKKKPDNLIICDFICRGVISPLVYQSYIEYLENKYGAKATIVHFKNKTYGWHRFSTKITFENGKEYIQDRYHDSYMLLYLRENISLRPSCYECRFKGIERCSDLTVGDFWGLQGKYSDYDNDHGTSAIFVNTELGREFLLASSNLLSVHSVNPIDIIKGNDCVLHSPACQGDRKKFFDLLKTQGYSTVKRKYCSTLFTDTVQRLLKGVKHAKK